MKRILKRQKDGSLVLPTDLVEALAGQGETLVLHGRPGSLVVTPAQSGKLDDRLSRALEQYEKNAGLHYLEGTFQQNAGGTSGMFKGDLSILGPNDVLTFLHGGRKTGQLAIILPGRRMALFLREGRLIRVASEGVEDQWPSFLLKRHEATANDLFMALEGGGAGHGLETALARQAHLAAAEQAERQVAHEEGLLYQILRSQEGEFVFFEGGLPDGECRAFPMDLANYVLEAARILDETSRLEAVLPDRDTVLEARAAEGLALEPEEASLFGLVDGKLTLGDILQISTLTQGESVRLLSGLIQAGLVRAQTPEGGTLPGTTPLLPEPVRKNLEGIFSRYQDVFAMILPALVLEKGEDYVLQVLDTFWQGPAKATILAGVPFPGVQGLMADTVVLAASTHPQDPQGAMVTALNELLYFLVFAVKDSLGPEVEQGIVEAARSVLSA